MTAPISRRSILGAATTGPVVALGRALRSFNSTELPTVPRTNALAQFPKLKARLSTP
ncbi:hypothetical protein [Nocardioides humi]|uniref:Uncharacterized protein n=1 Tax=Nocardioides humi TaxID=449461 RepID=A0ABN2BF22_9ACTN|nr:hypothetical protein [Nocardioides humi]